jgi:L-asparaginase
MKIAFIQTGGTIDKDYPRLKGGWAFEFGEAAFRRILSNVQHTHETNFYEVFKKDSLEITSDDREDIKDFVSLLKENKVVITHGSDTLLKTAGVLSTIKDKTICLTASMLPEKFKDSDASFNLGMAVAAAQILKSGVYVAINGTLGSWDRFYRDQKTGLYYI